jgi:hypothetical protein
MQTDLLRPKELAAKLRRATSYVYAMRRHGFPMPGGTATLEEARRWLARHPQPRKEGVKAQPKTPDKNVR